MVVRRKEKRLLTGIIKQLHLLHRQPLRFVLPALLTGRLMQSPQSRRQTCVIVQIRTRTTHALTPRTHQLTLFVLQLVQQKSGRPLRQLQITRSTRQTTTGRQCLNHQRVPLRQDLVVQKWTRASTTTLQQLRSRFPQTLTRPRLLTRQIQNPPMLKILRLTKTIHPQKLVRFSTQNLANLRLRPDIKLTLNRVRFGIEGRTETTVGQSHLASQKADQLVHHLLVQRIRLHLQCLCIHLQQLRLVVQHLFKMGHRPRTLSAVPMKATTQMIANSAPRHGCQRVTDRVPQLLFARLSVQAEQKPEPRHVRKPRTVRTTRIEIHSAPRRVILGLNALRYGLQQCGIQLDRLRQHPRT